MQWALSYEQHLPLVSTLDFFPFVKPVSYVSILTALPLQITQAALRIWKYGLQLFSAALAFCWLINGLKLAGQWMGQSALLNDREALLPVLWRLLWRVTTKPMSIESAFLALPQCGQTLSSKHNVTVNRSIVSKPINPKWPFQSYSGKNNKKSFRKQIRRVPISPPNNKWVNKMNFKH